MSIFGTPQPKIDNNGKKQDKDKDFCLFRRTDRQENIYKINVKNEENKDKKDNKDKDTTKINLDIKHNNENEDDKDKDINEEKKEIINNKENEDKKENEDIKDNKKNEDNKDNIENKSKRKNNLYISSIKSDNKADISKKISSENENNNVNGNDNGFNLNQFNCKTQIHSKRKKDFLREAINLNMFESEDSFNKADNNDFYNINKINPFVNNINNNDIIINGNNNINNEQEDKKINGNNNINNNNFNNNNNNNNIVNNLNIKNNIINKDNIIKKNNTLDIDNNRRNNDSNKITIKINKKNSNDINNININHKKDINIKNEVNNINNNMNKNNINFNNININDLNHKDSDDLKIKKRDNSSKPNKGSIIGSLYPNQKNLEFQKEKKNQEKEKQKKLEEELSRAQVKDHFNCYICYSNIINPRMCRFCKKLACEQCIKLWLKTKNICGFCKNKITFNDTISVPFVEELSNFFLNEVEKEPIKEEDRKAEAFSKSVNDNKNENINKCNKHNNLYEYYCIDCNKYYCPNCLFFLNDSSKIHENHSVIPIKLLENKNVKDTIDEYKKLFISKDNMDNLIKFCNLKLKEMEIEKNQLINNLDLASRYILDKIDVKIVNVRNKFIGIKMKDDELTGALETTPIALQNIVKTKDYGQNEKIYEHLNNIKKGLKNTEYISNNNNLLSSKIKNNCVESFTSDLFEFELPYNGKYVDKKIIFVQKLDNFIPENKCHISLKYDSNHICFNVRIISNKKINQDKVKYYGYIIIRNQKYDCEFVVMEDKINIDMHILNIQFSSNHFISFKDENNKIRFKIYIMKIEKK